jgi:hypothetical protein
LVEDFPFFTLAVLKVIVDLLTMLIGAEGARLLENAIAFPSCVGGLKDVHSMSCGRTGQGRPRRRLSAEEAPRTARGKRSFLSANQQASLTQPLH